MSLPFGHAPLDSESVSDVPVVAETKPAEDFRRVTFDVPGGSMAGISFGDSSRPADIVFLHATGLNARAYRALLSPLGDRYHLVAIDARGHGRTTLPAGRLNYDSWRRHRDDLIVLLERHFTKSVDLAGHSLGGTVALLTAAKRPDLVTGLTLIDPVIRPPAIYAAFGMPGAIALSRAFLPIAAKASERRRRFPNREAALKAFTGRGFFRTFPPEMLADYVADGFVDTPNGDVKLACSPSYECATFAAQRNAPWSALRRVHCPIVMLRAEEYSTTPYAAAQLFAQTKPEARIATVENSTHALPFERPDRVRAAIEAAALMSRQGGWLEEVD